MNIAEKYIKNFKIENTNNSIIYKHRLNALEQLKNSEMDFNSDEKYKNYNINEIFDYEHNNTAEKINLNEYFHCQIEDLDTYIIILSNGIFYGNENKNLDNNVIICSLKEASIKYSDLFEKYFNKKAASEIDSFTLINTLYFNDGVFIYVPENVKLEKAIQIINISHGFENKSIFTRNLFIAEKKSELSVIICNHTLNNSKNFIVDVTESYLEENAILNYNAIQNEHNQSIVNNFHFTELRRAAKLNSLELLLNGKFLKNNIFVDLKEEISSVNLFGLSLADKQQIFDNYTLINHIAPNCESYEMYKNILDDESLCSFEGKIIVRKEAQKTIAYQSNKNICLTDSAKINTKPQLEIYADDVKCSHGTTIGQLDEQAVFYLQQRGISQKEARQMLMFAFANDILNNIDIIPLKNKISVLIDARLRGELSDRCNCLLGCVK